MEAKRIKEAVQAAKRFPLVQVIWLDHSSIDRWKDLDEIKEYEPVVIITTGHLVHENEDAVFISLNIGEEDTASCTMNILKKLIINRKKLCTT